MLTIKTLMIINATKDCIELQTMFEESFNTPYETKNPNNDLHERWRSWLTRIFDQFEHTLLNAFPSTFEAKHNKK